MRSKAFETVITETSDSLVGPWRRPHQMLNAQVYDSHASIHDDATAQKLGFQGGTIEGPTHFSQFAPLCASVWGQSWFEAGCISAHYRNPSFEGEEVQAMLAKPEPGQKQCQIQMVKRDGTEILRGTANILLPRFGSCEHRAVGRNDRLQLRHRLGRHRPHHWELASAACRDLREAFGGVACGADHRGNR